MSKISNYQIGNESNPLQLSSFKKGRTMKGFYHGHKKLIQGIFQNET